jgi:rhodanese-related sulfurtransferase
MLNKQTGKEILTLLAFAIGIALGVNAISPMGIALIGEWDISKGAISARSKHDVVFHELEIGDVRTAQQLYRAGGVVFVDARAQETFAAGHIRGAFSIPVDRFVERIEEFAALYPLFTHIVTYCSGRECSDSHQVAQDLIAAGYVNTQVFVDGYPAWEKEGLPIEP